LLRSHAFAPETFAGLHTLFDWHFTFGSDQVGGNSVRTLEVNKINTTELRRDNTVSFVVDPDIGMRLLPLNKSRA